MEVINIAFVQLCLNNFVVTKFYSCTIVRSKAPVTNDSKNTTTLQGFTSKGNVINPMAMVRDFDYGTVKKENGRTVREFQIVAKTSTFQLNSAVSFVTWNFNGRCRAPGPTLRATEGDR